MQVLQQSIASTVTEFIAKSHFGNKSLSWKYNTGEQVINSNKSAFTDVQTIIIIESNYSSSGVYSVNASINSSNFTDNAQRVVVT